MYSALTFIYLTFSDEKDGLLMHKYVRNDQLL